MLIEKKLNELNETLYSYIKAIEESLQKKELSDEDYQEVKKELEGALYFDLEDQSVQQDEEKEEKEEKE